MAVLFFIFAGAAGYCLAARAATFNPVVVVAGTGIITVSSPTKTADDSISVSYKDKEGNNQSVTASTGESGSANTGDDLSKDMSAEDKAIRYKKALDESALVTEHGGTVTANGSAVTIYVPGGSVKSISFANNTKQKDLEGDVHGSMPSIGGTGMELIATPYTKIGRMTLTGFASGVDDDGMPSMLKIGTDRGTVLIAPQAGQSAGSIAWMLVSQLRSQYRIQTMCPAPGVVDVYLHQGVDGGLKWGTSDTGVDQTAGVEVP